MSEFGRRRGMAFAPFKRRRRSTVVVPARFRRRRRRKATIPRNLRFGGFMGLEMKFKDTETVADAFSVTWNRMDPASNTLSGVAQGDGESQRDGRVYWIHKISIRVMVTITAAKESEVTPPPDQRYRYLLVLDKQTNGAAMGAGDVIINTGNNKGLEWRNLQHTKRFQVLWDQEGIIHQNYVNEGAANLFAANVQSTFIKVFHKTFKNPLKVTCTGTTDNVNVIADNSLHMIGLAGTELTMDYKCRIRFTG